MMNEKMKATQMLYAVAGEPAVDGVEKTQGSCWLCGNEIAEGVLVKTAIKDTFMDIDKCVSPSSTHICCACAWCFSEQLNFEGYEKPQRMRTYSHFVVNGKWLRFTKAHKVDMRTILFYPPTGEWLAVIADSGQKHIIFRAAVSHDRSCAVQFEEQQILFYPESLIAIYEIADSLYQSGFNKTEIETGAYNQNRIIKFGLNRWQEIESKIKNCRGSKLFELALFLMTKKDEREEQDANA